MHSIALIGAGQLGSRHLQGLARLDSPCRVTVVDPAEASLAVAKARFDEMPPNPAIGDIRFVRSLDSVPAALDYAVIATAADVRLDVLRALLQRSEVRFLLLEKVLFQRLGDYAAAAALLEAHRAQAWVNCARRVFPIYARVRAFFANDPLKRFQVLGGGWGLGCNAIHFLDLLAMLTSAAPGAISRQRLDPSLVASKRANFREFTGSLDGNFGDTAFELTSLAGSSARVLVTLRSESRSCLLDETGGQAFFHDGATGADWFQERFRVPLISEVGTSIASRILNEGTSELPTFEESCAVHLPLIATLAAHAASVEGTAADFCPVT